MTIEMAGGVYCPLPPRDPQQRLHALVQQTRSRLVLVHWLTKAKFENKFILVNIDLLLINNNNNNVQSDADVDRLSNVSVTSDDIAYIIFTSGSTGTPKAVSHHFDNGLALYCYLVFDRLNFDIEI
jgi:non-ribosomal peptide synthetase component F